jgi:hypothetical protein
VPHDATLRTGRALERLVAVGLVVSLLATACGAGRRAPRDGLEADTARFAYGDRTAEVSLTACGREDDVVVLGGASNGVVLQVVADLGEDGAARTGVTADLGGDGIVGAFGDDMARGPAGEIIDVRAEGDRLIVEGVWTTFDGDLREITPAQEIEGRMVARCPETDDDTA